MTTHACTNPDCETCFHHGAPVAAERATPDAPFEYEAVQHAVELLRGALGRLDAGPSNPVLVDRARDDVEEALYVLDAMLPPPPLTEAAIEYGKGVAARLSSEAQDEPHLVRLDDGVCELRFGVSRMAFPLSVWEHAAKVAEAHREMLRLNFPQADGGSTYVAADPRDAVAQVSTSAPAFEVGDVVETTGHVLVEMRHRKGPVLAVHGDEAQVDLEASRTSEAGPRWFFAQHLRLVSRRATSEATACTHPFSMRMKPADMCAACNAVDVHGNGRWTVPKLPSTDYDQRIADLTAQRDRFRRIVGAVCGFVNETGPAAREALDEERVHISTGQKRGDGT